VAQQPTDGDEGASVNSPTLSVVINTRNAAGTLEACLRSVLGWADEVVVMDQQSEDGSAQIAAGLGAKVLTMAPTGFVEPARAEAVAAATGDWILIVDADEMVTRELRSSLPDVLREPPADVLQVPRRNRVFGVEMTTGPFAPVRDRQTRLFRAGTVVFSDVVHVPPAPVPGARVSSLPLSGGALLHLAYLDIGEFVERNARYSRIEAERRHACGERPRLGQAVAEATRRLVAGLAKHRGLRGGWRGVHVSILWALAPLWVDAWQRQLRETGDRNAVATADLEAAREHAVSPDT
jgi:(heptosyl)LPS beta-1,4-glucosyltransferase